MDRIRFSCTKMLIAFLCVLCVTACAPSNGLENSDAIFNQTTESTEKMSNEIGVTSSIYDEKNEMTTRQASVVSQTNKTKESVSSKTETVSSRLSTKKTMTTGKKSTSTTKASTPATTKNINTLPSKWEIMPRETISISESIIFPFESEDYSEFRDLILELCPEEKNLDQFRAVKNTNTEPVHDVFHTITFTRWINDCKTESHYMFCFDEEGKLFELKYRSPEYNSSKVVPPRTATVEEIEQAKKEESAKVPENCMVWEQRISPSQYHISKDCNFFSVQTIYASKVLVEERGYLDESSPYYGQTPAHASHTQEYVIPR